MAAKFEIYEDAGGKYRVAPEGGERANNRLERRELR
jgi:hypothetical protein